MNGISIVFEDKTTHYWPLPLLQRAIRTDQAVYLDFVQEKNLIEVTEETEFLWGCLRGSDRYRPDEAVVPLDPQVKGRFIQRPTATDFQ